jgi:hypothetical protein
MGHIGTAFGIVVAKHCNWSDILRLVAKKATVRTVLKDGTILQEVTYSTPDTIYTGCYDVDLRELTKEPEKHDEIIFECYPDVDVDGYDMKVVTWDDQSEFTCHNLMIDGLHMGDPTTCAFMVYVESEVYYEPRVTVEDPDDLKKLVDLFKRLKAEGRIHEDAYIGLLSNCCS